MADLPLILILKLSRFSGVINLDKQCIKEVIN